MTETPVQADVARRDRWLVLAGIAFAMGSSIHIADHLRRGQGSVTDSLYVAGNLALVIQVAVVTLIVTRHRVAPIAAVAAGFPLAIGFMAAHWLPEWSSLSDSFVEDGASWMSYVASVAEILGAVAIGVAGLAVLRTRGLGSVASRPTPA